MSHYEDFHFRHILKLILKTYMIPSHYFWDLRAVWKQTNNYVTLKSLMLFYSLILWLWFEFFYLFHLKTNYGSNSFKPCCKRKILISLEASRPI